MQSSPPPVAVPVQTVRPRAATGRQGLVLAPGSSTENKGCGSRSEKETSMRKSFMRKGAAAVVAALMVLSVGSAYAQTQGMERRDDRGDDRAGARDEKQACKAGDENTRAECRQEKRDSSKKGGKTAARRTRLPRRLRHRNSRGSPRRASAGNRPALAWCLQPRAGRDVVGSCLSDVRAVSSCPIEPRWIDDCSTVHDCHTNEQGVPLCPLLGSGVERTPPVWRSLLKTFP